MNTIIKKTIEEIMEGVAGVRTDSSYPFSKDWLTKALTDVYEAGKNEGWQDAQSMFRRGK